MKVTSETDPKAYLARQNEGLRDQIALKEKEIELVKKIYDEKVADQRLVGEEKLALQHDLNQQKIHEALEQKEERLHEVKKNFDQTAELLEKERATLGEDHSQKRQDLLRLREHNFQNELLDAQEETVELRQKTQEKLQTLKNDLNWKVQKTAIENQRQARELEQKSLDKVLNQETSGQEALRTQGIQHAKFLAQVKRENEQHIQAELNQHENRLKDHESKLQSQMHTKTSQFEYLTKQQEEILKNRYERLLEDHQALMETTKAKLTHEYEKLVEGLTQERTLFETRASDPFYRIEKLEPELIEDLESYTVRLKIPEHEKENVTIAPLGRQLKVSFVRNFNDRQEEPTGTVNQASRSETYTKILQVPDIMNAKGLSQRYHEGHLEVRIAKL